jgi:D-alanyl-D-alanine carboxypeptidase/D-alanyl-D-alanine-endopeptidase (penicillin-binding protein 4)
LTVLDGKLRLSPRNFGIAVVRGKKEGDLHIRKLSPWRFRIDGALPTTGEVAQLSLPDPALCAARIFSTNAKRMSGLKPPAGARSLAPRTVRDVLNKMLVESNNHYAETMLRYAGAIRAESGNWDDSLSLVNKLLSRIGISGEAFRITDGSGLSRFNEVSPRLLVDLIEWEETQVIRLSSLIPGPGQGTLKSRLAGLDVRAKTGTMSGVCCLAGVLEVTPKTAGGEGLQAKRRIVFAMMFNHYAGKASRPREIQDAILRLANTRLGG